MLTQERLKELLDYDTETGVFTWKVKPSKKICVGDVAKGTFAGRGYLKIKIQKKDYYLHRLAWFYTYGVWPKETDHINRNKTDNRLCNLREATRSENNQNKGRQANNTSGFIGVYKHSLCDKWVAQIKIQRRGIYLGLFNTPKEANAAYVRAKAEHHKF